MPVRQLTPELVTRLTRTGAWTDRPLYAAFDEAAARSPEVLAVVDQHERLTYADVRERSINLAAWLLEQELSSSASVGLQCGNRVALAITHWCATAQTSPSFHCLLACGAASWLTSSRWRASTCSSSDRAM